VAIPDSKLAREICKGTETMQEPLNKRQFETIVSCGLKGNLGTGVMPAWGDNPTTSVRTSKIYGPI
jgi:hypothetical protein